MIEITTIPASTATSQQLLVEVTEQLCKKVCVNEGRIISGTIQFSVGAPTIMNGITIAPITATGTIVMSESCASCEGNTVNFAERFEVPFTSVGTNVVTVAPGVSNVVTFADVKCCHATKAKLTTTITVAIA